MLSILTLIYGYIRPIIKWFLRRFTRLCELQRICYGSEKGAPRKKGIEQSLILSQKSQIKDLVSTLNESVTKKMPPNQFHELLLPYAVSTILKVKRVKAKIHPDFGKSIGICIETIWSYRRLCAEIEEIRRIPYDCNDDDHEQKLLELWQLLMPTQPLEARVTKQWQDIGFQGDNPMSDFRGMGLLGLENLLYFARDYNGAARHVLSHSMHPIHGYTFAIVGINLTSMAYNLLQNGAAKTHFYNLSTQCLSLKHFHRLYCYLFYEFDKFWMECKPNSIMEFSNIHARFLSHVLDKLNDDRTIFKIIWAVDSV